MPAHDIIIHFTTALAIMITYNIDRILSKADTLGCLKEAQIDIPSGADAESPVPGPQIYSSGNVMLTLLPNTSPVMLWSEWNATISALEWFTREYEAMAMVFSVMDWFDASRIFGRGGIANSLSNTVS